MSQSKTLDFSTKAQLLHLLCNSLQGLMPSAFLIPLPLFPLLWKLEPHSILFSWFFFSILVDLSRYYLAKHYLKENPTPVTSTKMFTQWANKLTIAYLLGGIRWAIVAYAFFHPDKFITQSLIFAIIFVIFTGLIFTSSMLPKTFYAYSIPIIIAITLRIYVYEGITQEFFSFCFTITVFYIVSIKILSIARESNIESIKLRFKNIDLINKLKEEKKVAEKANRKKTSFLATASHDLRQPVQSLELLVDTLGSHSYQEVTISKIKSSTKSLSSLLDNLLDISKLDANVMKFKKLPISLTTLFSQMQTDFEESAKQKNIQLIIKPINKNIYTDPTLFFRILSNLLDNAIKYTEQGSITLSAETVKNKISIRVIDTGIGIPKNKQETVFDEFEQLQNSGRDRQKGLGLGLSICLRVSHLLNHEITLSSDTDGTQVELLVDEAHDALPEIKTPTVFDIDLSNKIILVIENEEDIRYALGMTLRNWHASVFEASNRTQALLILKYLKHPADLIICDYRLENDDGVSIISEIQRVSPYTIPSIILTGDIVHKEIENLDHSQILVKPVSTEKLKSVIGLSIQSAP